MDSSSAPYISSVHLEKEAERLAAAPDGIPRVFYYLPIVNAGQVKLMLHCRNNCVYASAYNAYLAAE